ncbi:NADH-quinone oxidoreductase subunit NuoN [Tenggerimyces flavus]|uniref:NADH-quinone oxidoreductase subunit N n=1 Tax=Tenggerimyces flavus TaxID=1708749 RepID=A0ABV7Y512_9ACTN|nr:NADH-quinone oxidoreductase subunit NuoN [Tenggerimyces flavus]MBM7791187.1 NADH-quinone oxidoreductase subunit N [Tenggerimyces flavus]
MPEFTAPTIEYGQIMPMLVVFGVAILGIILEAFLPRRIRYVVQVVLSLGALIVALVLTIRLAGAGSLVAEGTLAVDGFTLFLWGTILALAILSLLLIAERSVDGGVTAFAAQAAALPGTEAERETLARRLEQTEVFPLFLFAVGGMLMFPAANDLLTMFVALEVLSLPLYLLCGLARRRRLLSQESALKYFLLGAFSSGFFLYGAALLYGFAGSVSFSGLSAAVTSAVGLDGLLVAGIALVAVGLLFKIGAAPFHVWTPDVYQGAPTSITAFMAACTKIAAFGALMRLFYVGLGGARWDWQPMIWVVAILTMAVGAVLALTQSDIKRMLAYSSIAHAGFLLVGFVGVRDSIEASTSSVLFYLAAYGFATVGAFAVVTLVRDASGEATHLSRWAGLGRRSPLVAGVMTLFLLAFAGIPLTSGFMGKWAVFSAAWAGGAWPLVVVAVIASVVAAFFYVRIIVLMFFSEPAPEGPTVAVPSVFTSVAVAVGVAATVVLGLLPQPLFELASRAAQLVG